MKGKGVSFYDVCVLGVWGEFWGGGGGGGLKRKKKKLFASQAVGPEEDWI